MSKQVEDFFARVSFSDDCWKWKGAMQNRGYGYFIIKRKRILAHRWAYEYFREPLAAKFCLHHCDVRNCVNPFHLFAGTAKDNNIDMSEKGRHRNGKKTHCIRGHAFNYENTGLEGKKRYCKKCKAMRDKLRCSQEEL